jgi:hypothetical protein
MRGKAEFYKGAFMDERIECGGGMCTKRRIGIVIEYQYQDDKLVSIKCEDAKDCREQCKHVNSRFMKDYLVNLQDGRK